MGVDELIPDIYEIANEKRLKLNTSKKIKQEMESGLKKLNKTRRYEDVKAVEVILRDAKQYSELLKSHLNE